MITSYMHIFFQSCAYMWSQNPDWIRFHYIICPCVHCLLSVARMHFKNAACIHKLTLHTYSTFWVNMACDTSPSPIYLPEQVGGRQEGCSQSACCSQLNSMFLSKHYRHDFRVTSQILYHFTSRLFLLNLASLLYSPPSSYGQSAKGSRRESTVSWKQSSIVMQQYNWCWWLMHIVFQSWVLLNYYSFGQPEPLSTS